MYMITNNHNKKFQELSVSFNKNKPFGDAQVKTASYVPYIHAH